MNATHIALSKVAVFNFNRHERFFLLVLNAIRYSSASCPSPIFICLSKSLDRTLYGCVCMQLIIRYSKTYLHSQFIHSHHLHLACLFPFVVRIFFSRKKCVKENSPKKKRRSWRIFPAIKSLFVLINKNSTLKRSSE